MAWLPFVRDLPDAARRLWNCFAGEMDDLSEFASNVGVRRKEIPAYLNRAQSALDSPTSPCRTWRLSISSDFAEVLQGELSKGALIGLILTQN